MLSEKQLKDFIDLYEKQFGKTITRTEATRAGIKLVELMRLLVLQNAKKTNINK
jgi:hypothetical protein